MNKTSRSYGRVLKNWGALKVRETNPAPRPECRGNSQYVGSWQDYSPKSKMSKRKHSPKNVKNYSWKTSNRATTVAEHQDTNITPLQKSSWPFIEKYKGTLYDQYDQYGFNPVTKVTIKELQNALCGFSPSDSFQVEESPPPGLVPAVQADIDSVSRPDDSIWKNVDTIDDIEPYITEQDISEQHIPENREPKIRISDKPKVTVIAEKFTRFKKEDLEVRKLDTRIVCIEYDIFDTNYNPEKLIQKMRAFFSVKPTRNNGSSTTIPSEILKRFDITETEFQHLSENEIELIDGKINENQPYLDSLRKVLKKKQDINEKKARNTLDLFSMYQMAKTSNPPLDCDFSSANLLSKAELDEVKNLILQRCDSPNDLCRRTVRRKNDSNNNEKSESMFLELLKDQDKK